MPEDDDKPIELDEIKAEIPSTPVKA